MGRIFDIPKERYLDEPSTESCYTYMRNSSSRIINDIGDYTAIIYNDNKISVMRLIKDSDKLADYLSAQGIGHGDVVTAFLPTSVHAFTVFYACSKIGAIASFIHPMTPANALDEMMQLTRSKFLFMLDMFVPAYGEIVNKYDTVVCGVRDYWQQDFPQTTDSEAPTIHPYAYIMQQSYPLVDVYPYSAKETAVYLSGGGTTGKSKTVQLSSFAMNNGAYGTYTLDLPHEYGKMCNLCALPCFHAFGLIVSMHYSVCNAYANILMPVFDAHKANELIHKYPTSVIVGVPNMFKKMMLEDNFRGPGLSHFMHLAVGGDYVSTEFLQEFNAILEEYHAPGHLVRGYSLTEMTACGTTNEKWEKDESVGYPYWGVEIATVDEDGNINPAGAEGEIIICGKTMMNGYLPDGYITESGFWADKTGKNWIRTGDIGYVDEEGFLFFTGRKKRIIIISGYNIFPDNIERKINTLDSVLECCAVQGYDENKKPLVRLYVVSTEPEIDQAHLEQEIRAFCEENIEAIARPREIKFMKTLPRTKMDKIDFMALTQKKPE